MTRGGRTALRTRVATRLLAALAAGGIGGGTPAGAGPPNTSTPADFDFGSNDARRVSRR